PLAAPLGASKRILSASQRQRMPSFSSSPLASCSARFLASSLSSEWARLMSIVAMGTAFAPSSLLDAAEDPEPARGVDRVAHAVLREAEEHVLGRRLEHAARHAAGVFHRSLVALRHGGLEVVLGGGGELLREIERVLAAAGVRRGALRALVLDEDD